jgi:capsular polysaccharide transport system permease protein
LLDDEIEPVARDGQADLPDVSSPQLGLTLPQPRSSVRLRRVGGGLPQLPQRPTRRSHGMLASFIIFVVLPTVLAAYYFTFAASNQYASEFRFAVKNASSTVPSSAGVGLGSSAGGGGSTGATLLSMIGGGSSPDMTNNYIVIDYLGSGQAVKDLQERVKIVDLYSRPNVDWWSRFNSARPLEWFVNYYWPRMLTAQFDPMTGIATVQVRAFTPEDVKTISETMLKLSEELINRIVVRMQGDTVRFAQNEVRRAEDRLKVVRAKLTEFRNKSGVIDPSGSLVASNSQLVQTLRASLAQLETQMTALKADRLDATSPVVQRLTTQIKATKDQIAAVERDVSKTTGSGSLSDTVSQYEQLDMERQFAQTMLTGAQQSLDQARAVAAAQLLYVEPYVRPSLPQSAVFPKRLSSIALAAFFALVGWMVLMLIVRSVREHYA